MEKDLIISGNKLIAEFMGRLQEHHIVEGFDQEYGTFESRPETEHDWKYHTSWDWLMPVVEKIEGMGYKTIIGGGDEWGNYCNVMYGLSLAETSDTKALGKGASKIEAIYSAVIQFIQFITWLNDKK